MSKIRRLLFAAAFGATLLSPAIASAAQSTVKVSTPFAATGNVANTKKFNVTVSAVSPDKSDIIDVKLLQNGNQVAAYSEGATTYGDSWSYPVTVASDGDYTFVAKASDGSSDTTTVKVDTSTPASPVYRGSTRSGNKITVTFSAPANADVTTIKIFSSTKPSFTADDSTLVGTLTIGPGETKSFTFTVDSAATRYTAVQAFDSAGNGSALVGDPQTNATSAAQTTNSSSTSTASSANGSTAQNGQVKSDETNKNNQDSKPNNSDNKSDNKESNKDWIWWVVIVLFVVGLAGAYVRYMRGEDDNSFWPKSKK